MHAGPLNVCVDTLYALIHIIIANYKGQLLSDWQ